MWDQLKPHFLLDEDVHFLNHGSFGACPRPVFETYQAWQRRLERQPVLFLGREHDSLLREARQALASYVNAGADDLAYIPNVTFGVNIVARALPLQAGDEILTTDHEYGACDYAWELACRKNGARYVHQALPLPLPSFAGAVDLFWQGVTERTRVIYLSHITSPTAQTFPVADICRRARQAGILTVIDGAHAPGQIELDLPGIGADFYLGNCHKWLCAPKGAGFIHAGRAVQALIEPLVVSWGYHPAPGASSGSTFLDYLQWPGTYDPAAYLAVPDAIRFLQEQRWERVRAHCHDLLARALAQIEALTGLPPAYLPGEAPYYQMAVAELPGSTDLAQLKDRLWVEHRVEVPLIEWNGRKFVRISVQGYNTPDDLESLVHGLAAGLGRT